MSAGVLVKTVKMIILTEPLVIIWGVIVYSRIEHSRSETAPHTKWLKDTAHTSVIHRQLKQAPTSYFPFFLAIPFITVNKITH